MMKLFAQPEYVFIPKFNGNEKLPPSEQITIEIIRPKAEDRGELSYTQVSRDGQTRMSFKTGFNVGTILRNHVGVIKNLAVEQNGKDGKPNTAEITDGKTLAESTFYGQNALVDEICAEVCSDVITPAQKKSGQ